MYFYTFASMKKRITFTLLCLLLVSCQNKPTTVLSVYFWRTDLNFTTKEQQFLDRHQIEKVYVRYCDVAIRNAQAVPIAPIEIKKEHVENKQIIPVIYIKNEVFLDASISVEILAENLHRYINQINKTYEINPNEIQFDCDWSLKSKERYFEFLQLFRQKQNIRLSATIRLHQVKYHQKTGVPPVDYGVLMYYNMDKITASGRNSIYNRETAMQYLPYLKKYPLELNVALPIFSWGVHSQNGVVQNLVGGLTSDEMTQFQSFEKISDNIYLVTEQTEYKGRIWEKGDQIKIEEISETDLQTMKTDLEKYLDQAPKEIILYDLNTNIDRYESKIIENLR